MACMYMFLCPDLEKMLSQYGTHSMWHILLSVVSKVCAGRCENPVSDGLCSGMDT